MSPSQFMSPRRNLNVNLKRLGRGHRLEASVTTMHKPEHTVGAIFRNAERMENHPLNWPEDHWYVQSSEERRALWRMYREFNSKPAAFPEILEEFNRAARELWYY